MKRLKAIAKVLRDERTDYLKLVEAINDYEALVLEVSDLEISDESNKKDIKFENGKALGTTWAALCIRDMLRTKTFVKGLINAVQYVKDTKVGPLHVMYAGTGPFATLVLPLMATFSEEEVQFTLLEVNPVSFENVNRVIDKLGFRGYIKAAMNVDATKHRVNPDERIDIVLCEAMQPGLKWEQQVSIVMNIMRQLQDDTIFIPEKITLDLCLINIGKFHTRQNISEEQYCIRLGTFFELSREKIREYHLASQKGNGKVRFPKMSFELPLEQLEEFNCLAILTEIQVFGEDRINNDETGLTIPMILENITAPLKGRTIKIGYMVDKEPGSEHEWI